MSDYPESEEVAVDRHEETVTTRQPGYAATQQVVRDVAAERRLRMGRVNQIVYTILGILQILLGLRFALKLIAADPNAGFAAFIYGITAPFVAPFAGLVANWSTGGSVLEVTTLIAMAVYALFFWVVLRIIPLLLDRPSARSVTRATTEQTADGSERTTHTNVRG
jgi:uncharacterized membrane protein